jgi:hypothetical protein
LYSGTGFIGKCNIFEGSFQHHENIRYKCIVPHRACRKHRCFSAIPVALLQGSITLLAKFIKPIMTEPALANLSLIGSILIFCVGLNLVWGKKIRVANLLPAIIIAVAWAYIGC